jgi:hypothetical protein
LNYHVSQVFFSSSDRASNAKWEPIIATRTDFEASSFNLTKNDDGRGAKWGCGLRGESVLFLQESGDFPVA